MNTNSTELTILLPCLNEEETLGCCINKAKEFIARSCVQAEILVADNGSTDKSVAIAMQLGARVVEVVERGYGSALRAGITEAKGKFIIMGDADDSYDFYHLDEYLEKLRDGFDLVMGNRFEGGIERGAMPALHRYLGNPFLSWVGRLFFKSPVSDFHCGLRGFRREAVQKLQLVSNGMEFASEMVVKATLSGLRITEVPTTLSRDGRSRPPHLQTWRDGWRHLRFLLMYSPRWLFLYPGIALLVAGIVMSVLVLPGPLFLGSIVLDVHTLILSSTSILVGAQIIIFFLLAKQYATSVGLLPLGPRFENYLNLMSLEKALLFGIVLMVLGTAGVIFALSIWYSKSFGELDYSVMMRVVIPSVTLFALGLLIIMSGFLSGILDIETKRN